jgi:hypothetical protein
MSPDPTERKDSDKGPGSGSPIVLAGGLIGTGLAAVAAVLFLTRAQPAPEQEPAQSPATPSASEVVPLPPAPSPVAAPSEATTIVLDDLTPAEVAPAVWDGRSARGLQDGPMVLQAAVAAVGGEEVLPRLSRFTARFTTSQPVFATGDLVFDAKLGITLRRTDAPVRLTLTSAGSCVQWRSTQQIPVSCTSDQVDLMESLWHAARVWAIAPLQAGTLIGAGSHMPTGLTNRPQNMVNSVLVRSENTDTEGAPALYAEFEVATGVLRRAELPTRSGNKLVRYGNQRSAIEGATVAVEWSIFPMLPTQPAKPAAADDKDQEERLGPEPELAMPQQGFDGPFVIHLNAFLPNADRALFVVPRGEELNKPVAGGTLTPDAVPSRFLEFATDNQGEPTGADLDRIYRSWVVAMSDWVMIAEEGKPPRLGLGLAESVSLPPEFRKRLQTLETAGPMIGAVVPFAGDVASLRAAVVGRATALGRKSTGPVYMTVWDTSSLKEALEPDVSAFGSAVMLLAP